MTLPVRLIQVVEVGRVTPRMARVTFTGDGVADLVMRGPDQQVKLYFPKPGQTVPRLPEPDGDVMSWYTAYTAIPEPERPWMRSYTIRAHDPRAGTITIDFVLHAHQAPVADCTAPQDGSPRPPLPAVTGAYGAGIPAGSPTETGGGDGESATRLPAGGAGPATLLPGDGAGPATRWASEARPGDTLGMFGPSADFARPVPVTAAIAAADWLLLAGDETALPAIGTLIESLPPGTRAVAYIEVADAGEEQRFGTRGDVTVHWLRRDGVPAGHAGLLAEAVRQAAFPAGTMFAWLGGEAGAVRAIRRHLIGERGVDRRSIEFAGYWRTRLTQDDAPTEADLADARELLALATDAPTPQPVDDAPEVRPAREAAGATSPATEAGGFDRAYESGGAPWVIGGPQPAVVALERDGWIHGKVLDIGCGTGEHAIHLARLGYDAYGIDSSRVAIERARAGAATHEVAVRFEVADALSLTGEQVYDTIVDSALFHIFDGENLTRYVRALRSACRPGGLVHVLALSDAGPGYGPQISDRVIREAFGAGWELEDLRTSLYRGVFTAEGGLDDVPAWLARVRRV